MEASSALLTSDNTWSTPNSQRKFIDDIPNDIRRKLCTEIDFTIHQNEGYWSKISKFIFIVIKSELQKSLEC